jgi:hypothetical protein
MLGIPQGKRKAAKQVGDEPRLHDTRNAAVSVGHFAIRTPNNQSRPRYLLAFPHV